MTAEMRTTSLAETVMAWKAFSGRFIKTGRIWTPKWRFNPLTVLEDAFPLLDSAGGTLPVGSRSGRRFRCYGPNWRTGRKGDGRNTQLVFR